MTNHQGQASMRYRLNSDEVASEALEREVIVIHLTSGSYYSLRGSAPDIWEAVVRGWTVDEITVRLAEIGNATNDAIASQICATVAYFADEALIIPADNNAPAEFSLLCTQDSYSIPLVQKFTDMQELLLVDPIHEVTEAGWPERITPST